MWREEPLARTRLYADLIKHSQNKGRICSMNKRNNYEIIHKYITFGTKKFLVWVRPVAHYTQNAVSGNIRHMLLFRKISEVSDCKTPFILPANA